MLPKGENSKPAYLYRKGYFDGIIDDESVYDQRHWCTWELVWRFNALVD